MVNVAAVIVAAGSGVRTGGDVAKQFRTLGAKSVLRWSVDALAPVTGPDALVVVAAPDMVNAARAIAPDARVVAGGAARTDSVRRGLHALASAAPDQVLIHDAARPGLDRAVIDGVLRALETADGAAPIAPQTDSVRQIDAQGRIIGFPERAHLARVQTPQGFRYAAIMAAYRAWAPARTASDDLEIAAAAGLSLVATPGSARLHKITYPEDFAIMEALLGAGLSLSPRIGTGFDAHRFGPGDHVVLCGVKAAHSHGLAGHSDADVAWHALTDALLGSIGAGDIGDHFPPSDPQWRGASSDRFLRHAADLIAARGGKIANVDVTIICERPRIKPLREAMRDSTAAVLGVARDAVSIKATTTEEMGFTGRSEGIAAQASACVLAPSA